MANYKIGDVVQIIDFDEFIKCRGRNYNGRMDHWAGKMMTIRDIDGDNKYFMEEDIDEYHHNRKSGWVWYDYMIKGIVDINVINLNQNDLLNFLER